MFRMVREESASIHKPGIAGTKIRISNMDRQDAQDKLRKREPLYFSLYPVYPCLNLFFLTSPEPNDSSRKGLNNFVHFVHSV